MKTKIEKVLMNTTELSAYTGWSVKWIRQAVKNNDPMLPPPVKYNIAKTPRWYKPTVDAFFANN